MITVNLTYTIASGATEPSITYIGTGSGNISIGDSENVYYKIVAGTYGYISFGTLQNVVIDGTDVIAESMSIGASNNAEIFGLKLQNNTYRALTIYNHTNDLHLHDIEFKNIDDYTINYVNNTVYDGTDATASKNWIFENLRYENCSTGFNCNGGHDNETGEIINLMKNFKFLNNYSIDCGGNCVTMGAAEDYEIAYNTIEHINSEFPPNAPNGIHNGIFLIKGNGKFHHNKVTRHQGNAIRAWGFSFQGEVKTIEIYNNIVYDSWKYGAFELQMPPDMLEFMTNNPTKVTHCNAKVFNNTAGKLNMANDWDGQMLDLYNYGGSLEYFNNLGFNMIVSDGKTVTNMINDMSDTDITVEYDNLYFTTSPEAVADTIDFVSLHSGIGA